MQRHPSILSLHVDSRPRVEQQLHDPLVSVLGSEVHWHLAILRLRIDSRPHLEQQLHHRLMPVIGCEVQCHPSHIESSRLPSPRLGAAAAPLPRPHWLHRTAPSLHLESSRLEEQLNHRLAPELGCEVQWCVPMLILRLIWPILHLPMLGSVKNRAFYIISLNSSLHCHGVRY